MREVKFRGYHIDEVSELPDVSGWRFGYLIYNPDGKELFGKGHYIFDGHYYWAVVKGSIGQSTGLHDKNGVEIFEVDICKIEFGPLEKPYIGSVNFKYGKWMLGNAELFLHSVGCEVIGNIYENPELLEAQR